MSIEATLDEIRKTNMTSTVHRKPYPAISSTRPEVSQAGRAVLITGGGTGAGFAIARAFVRASASAVIIVGRRAEVLELARSRLVKEVEATSSDAKIIARSCDVIKLEDVDRLWEELASMGIVVDVYVANAAKFTEPKSLLELGTGEVWNQMETNVKSPLYFAERIKAQPNAGEKQKFIINVSTTSIHTFAQPVVAARPAYTLSKLAGTLLFQLLAQDHPHEQIQIVSFHPGFVYNEMWKDMGVAPENFDSGKSTLIIRRHDVHGASVDCKPDIDDLPGAFAVWAASKEAAFLHGRFVWCSWDVEELATGEIRRRLEKDPYYLRASVLGLCDA